MGWGSPKKGLNTKSKLQREWRKKQLCVFCFHNLPHKGAKGQSQRQRHKLARTSRQIARLAYRGGEHSPSYPASSYSLLPFLPVLPPSYAPAPKRLGQTWTLPTWQEPQLSTSKESPLKYHFAISNPPRTRTEPLPLSHKYLHSHTRLGLWGTFLSNQPFWRHRLTARSGGVSRILLGGSTGVREPTPQREIESGAHNGSQEVFRAEKLRLKTRQGHGTPCPLLIPSSSSLRITKGLGIWDSSP